MPVLAVALAACATNGEEENGLLAPEPIEVGGMALAYTPIIEGPVRGDLRDLLEQTSRLYRFRDRAPGSVQQIRRRAESDVESFRSVLRSEGYFQPEVSYRLIERADGVNAVLQVTPGPPFLLDAYRIRYVDVPADQAGRFPAPENLGLAIGAPARSEPIVAADRAIVGRLAELGRPYARVLNREVLVDHRTQRVTVEVEAEAGPTVGFGALSIEGLDRVDEALVRRMVPWRPSATFRRSMVTEYERALLATGLFSTAIVRHGDEPAPDGTVPLTLRVEETERRSVGGGVHYSTNQGVGVTGFWEHRNLFGEGERLRLSTRVAELDQQMSATITKPAFLHRHQTLLGDVTLQHENPEGYERSGLETSLGLERALSRTVTVQGRVSAEFSSVKDAFEQRDLTLFGLPLGARYDGSDSLLDPTTGFRATLNLTPFIGGDQSGEFHFARSRLGASAYQPLDGGRRFVAAVRGNIGSIFGADRERVPAHHRFYSGGGGSVRGFAPQLVGPLDARNEPLGGRSVAEAGLELRIRFWDNLGIVPFVEAGTVSEKVVPDFGGTYRWGAGLGIRYHTDFGPIRFDVAMPLNPRSGVDDAFQFYISVGQAF